MMQGWGNWILFVMFFWTVVVVGIIAVLVKLALGAGKSSSGDESETAMQILEKRYARGEIGREEFEERKSVISKTKLD